MSAEMNTAGPIKSCSLAERWGGPLLFYRVSHGASFLAPGSLARRRLARVIHHHLYYFIYLFIIIFFLSDLESGLNQRDEDAREFFCHTNARGPEIKTSGGVDSRRGKADWTSHVCFAAALDGTDAAEQGHLVE